MSERPRSALAATLPAVTELPCDPRSAARARRFLRETLSEHVAEEVLETAVLLTCELVTNAVEHAASGCTLRLSLGLGDTLRVDVADDDPTVPAVTGKAELLRESGRGLTLVDALAQEWGHETTPIGKATWFRLALDPEAHGSGRSGLLGEVADK